MARQRKIKTLNFSRTEKKWQKVWQEKEVFQAQEKGDKKRKYYVCEMFPYPSADFLHMGHLKNYSIGDCVARYRRMKGFDVLYPMGFDAFGLPAENAAIKQGIHPKKYAEHAIKEIKRMMKELGLSYDWAREIRTCDSSYYKWNQWLFLRMLEKGIAYRKKAPVNWCPSCDTTLANEEVIDGKCWRCESEVSVRHIEQWFLKITDYADELLDGLDKLDWPLRVKELQRNWIGRSSGTRVIFPVKGSDKIIEVFTTRADTLYGASFIALSAQHSMAGELVIGTRYEKKYNELLKNMSASEKLDVEKEKEGVFTGRYAVHPLTGEDVPIYASNFVVAGYGSGAVMGVPAHDLRDWDFAKKYKIAIRQAVRKKDGEEKLKEAFVEDGVLVNSDAFNGLDSSTARERISELLAKKGLGGKAVEYKLRDWLISRQRYWGTPIPIIYCSSCGVVPVPEKELPVLLPEKVKFTGKGNPLASDKGFLSAACPICGGLGKRETDTMATFFDSSWYYLRYCSPKSHDIFDRRSVGYWMPIDQYIGGIEHAVLHLLYARFLTRFLRDLGWLVFDEPFTRLFNQGILHKDGKRMSKSHGNTVGASEISKKYGVDSARLFLMLVASPEKDIEWSEHGIESAHKFAARFFRLADKIGGPSEPIIEHKLNKTIKLMERAYDNFEFNKGVIAFMELAGHLAEREKVPRHVLENLVRIISPIMPHVAEEMWHKMGRANLVSEEEWPRADESKIDEKFEEAERQNEKVIEDIAQVLNIVKSKMNREAENIYLYVLPKDIGNYNAEILSRRFGKEVRIFGVNDSGKHDPQNRAGKAKPGKPAIYVE